MVYLSWFPVKTTKRGHPRKRQTYVYIYIYTYVYIYIHTVYELADPNQRDMPLNSSRLPARGHSLFGGQKPTLSGDSK